MVEIRVPILRPFISADSKRRVLKVLSSRWIGAGPVVKEFEEAFRRRIGARAFVATSSGTAALNLAYHLAGVGPGDEVITTPMTCAATNLPLLQRGAQIRWADIEPDGTISPVSVRRLITERTRAVVAVHFGGLPCKMAEIRAALHGTSIHLIEDAAHAAGAAYDGKPIGATGEFVCFSFQAVKILTTGDGGGLAIPSLPVAERARRLSWFGMRRNEAAETRGIESESGFKYEMNDIAAAIGLGNIRRLSDRVAHNRTIAAYYRESLRKLAGLRLPFGTPQQRVRRSSHWLFPVLVDRRRDFDRAMAGRGIETTPVHFRNDRFAPFGAFGRDDLPGVDLWETSMTCLPIGHWVSTRVAASVVAAVWRGW